MSTTNEEILEKLKTELINAVEGESVYATAALKTFFEAVNIERELRKLSPNKDIECRK